MQDLSITLIQSELCWGDPTQNRKAFEEKFSKIRLKTDLVILPEMFTTGFTMHPRDVSEPMDGQTIHWLHKQAARIDAAIMGSFIFGENQNYFNRLVFMPPDGKLSFYDKKHLFRMAGENNAYQAGNRKEIIKYKGWNILPLICYDLRFPVWSRNRLIDGRFEYDLMVVIANWPAIRSHAWKTLLTARAIENQAYVAGVNRIGKDDNGIDYCGDSMAIDPWGKVLSSFTENQESVETIVLSHNYLTESRRKFAVSLDWDEFSIKVT